MGANESKITVETPRPERCSQIRNERVCQLVDPRSPSTGIDRTPIQVGDAAARGSAGMKCEDPALISDPRSPSIGITRTPMKDVMRATVSSFARRLGMLFLNEGGDTATLVPPFTFSKLQSLNLEEDGEMHYTEALLPPHPKPSLDYDQLSPGVCVPPALVCASDQACDTEALPTQTLRFQTGEDERQAKVEDDRLLGLEATLDKDRSLNKELSLSLLTCHDGVVLSQMVSVDAPRPLSPLPNIDPDKDLDSEACPSVQFSIIEASTTTTPICSDVAEPPNYKIDTPAKPESNLDNSPNSAAADPIPNNNQNLQAQAGLDQIRIKYPTFNTKSPSQVVFKPQWLGVGFGVAGVRARGVQGKGKGGSSPLSVRVGKKAGDENQGRVAKPKQRERCGTTLANEGRSPLQILKERNSPLDRTSQMKLKITTPDRQRLGQMDRRAFSVSLYKESQR